MNERCRFLRMCLELAVDVGAAYVLAVAVSWLLWGVVSRLVDAWMVTQ